jgi:hypothetical protein
MRKASLIALLLAGAAPAALAQEVIQVGSSAAVYGRVEVLPVIDRALRVAMSGEPMYLLDEISSALASGLQILLRDGTVFTVGPLTEIVIDRFVYDPDTGGGSIAATITSGFFRFVTGLIAANDPTDMTITAGAAEIGVRGTIGEGVVGPDALRLAIAAGAYPADGPSDPATAALVVLRGPGPLRTGPSRLGRLAVASAGVTVEVARPGWATLVPGRGLPPTAPFELPQAIAVQIAQSILAVDRELRPIGEPSEPDRSPPLRDPRVERPDRRCPAPVCGPDLPKPPDPSDALYPVDYDSLRQVGSGVAVLRSVGDPLSDSGEYDTTYTLDYGARDLRVDVLVDSPSFENLDIVRFTCEKGCDPGTISYAQQKGTAQFLHVGRGSASSDVDSIELRSDLFTRRGQQPPSDIRHRIELSNEEVTVTGTGVARRDVPPRPRN